MMYKEFFINELFPEKRIPISDEWLKQYEAKKVDFNESSNCNYKSYYYNIGQLTKLWVSEFKDSNSNSKSKWYSIEINTEHSRSVKYVDEIKLQIYSYIRAKYPLNLINSGQWAPIKDEEKIEKYMYDEYLKHYDL